MSRATELSLLALQTFHVAFLVLHDWIPLGRVNDLPAVRRMNSSKELIFGTLLMGGLFGFGLAFSFRYYGHVYPGWLREWLWGSYGILFLGELQAWWIPYLVRPEPARAERYREMFGRTHHFLPEHNGIFVNTLHVVLHAATLATLALLTRI